MIFKPTRYQQKNYEYNQKLEKKQINIHKSVQNYSSIIEKYSKIPEYSLYKYALLPSRRIKKIIDTPITKNLEQTILSKGFSGCILIKATEDGLIHIEYGFEELEIAQKHGLLIPTVVLDEDNLFKYSFHIKTEEELKKFIPNTSIKPIVKSVPERNNLIKNRKLKYAKRNMS